MEPTAREQLLSHIKHPAARLKLILKDQNLAALPPEIKELARGIVKEMMAEDPRIVLGDGSIAQNIAGTLFASSEQNGDQRIFLCYLAKEEKVPLSLRSFRGGTYLDVLGIKEVLGLDLMPDIEQLIKAYIDGSKRPEPGPPARNNQMLKAILEIGRRSADPAFTKMTRDHVYRSALLAENPKEALESVFGSFKSVEADEKRPKNIFSRTVCELRAIDWTDDDIAGVLLAWLNAHASAIGPDSDHHRPHLADVVNMLSAKCFGHRHDRRMDKSDWFDKRSAAIAEADLHTLVWKSITGAKPQDRAYWLKAFLTLYAMVVGDQRKIWTAYANEQLETLMSNGDIKVAFDVCNALRAADYDERMAIIGLSTAGHPTPLQRAILPSVLIGFCKAFSEGRFGIAAALSRKFHAELFPHLDPLDGLDYMARSGKDLHGLLTKVLAILGEPVPEDWTVLKDCGAIDKIQKRTQIALELAVSLGQSIALNDEADYSG